MPSKNIAVSFVANIQSSYIRAVLVNFNKNTNRLKKFKNTDPTPQSQFNDVLANFRLVKNTASGMFGIFAVFGFGIFPSLSLSWCTSNDTFSAWPKFRKKLGIFVNDVFRMVTCKEIDWTPWKRTEFESENVRTATNKPTYFENGVGNVIETFSAYGHRSQLQRKCAQHFLSQIGCLWHFRFGSADICNGIEWNLMLGTCRCWWFDPQFTQIVGLFQ